MEGGRKDEGEGGVACHVTWGGGRACEVEAALPGRDGVTGRLLVNLG